MKNVTRRGAPEPNAVHQDTPLISATGLEKWYGSVKALSDVSFDISHNQVVGLVGDNGAGKSTLIKILSGAHRPDRGQLYMDGQPVRFKSTKDAMAKGIETIYQQSATVPQLSISRNIFVGREPLKFRIGPFGILDTKKMARDSVEAIDDVGLRLRAPTTPVEELSGGELQGVVIARALHFKTRVLILDEPTNHLSVKETNKVLKFTEDLKHQGVTSIFISHNLHHVYPIADQIMVMARGEKIADLKKEDTSIAELTDMIV